MSEISSSLKMKPIELQKGLDVDKKTSRAEDKQKLREVADMYEQYFLKEMMKHMKSAQLSNEDGFIKKNNAEKIFQEQLDDQYSKEWNKTGSFGLADMLYNQLVDKFDQTEKAQGPVDSGSSIKVNKLDHDKDSSAFEIHADKEVSSLIPVKSPWAGTLQDKKGMDSESTVYRIKHDNGLESLISIQGGAGEKSRHLSVGDYLQAGDEIGLAKTSSPLFWTLKTGLKKNFDNT